MKFYLFFFFLPTFTQASWERIYKDKRPAIPMIFSSASTCSGALIREDRVLTAAHCVDKLREVNLLWPEEKRAYISAEVIAMDQEIDLALLKIPPQSSRKPIEVLSKDQKLEEGQEIATVGHPVTPALHKNPFVNLDFSYLISKGVISKINKKNLVVDSSVSPGNSGGPVFNSEGQLIGVVSAKRVDPFSGDIAVIINHETVNEFLQSNQKSNYPLSTWKAKDSIQIESEISYHSILDEFQDVNAGVFSLHWSTLWNDRISLDIGSSLFHEELDYQRFSLGYQFQILFANQSALMLTPIYSYHDYQIDTRSGKFEEHAHGLGLQMQWLPLPIRVSIYAFELDLETSYILALNLFLLR